MTLTARSHFDLHGQLLLCFSASAGTPVLSLGPFRTVCRLEEAASRLLISARSGASMTLVRADERLFLTGSGQRWRLPVVQHSDDVALVALQASLPALQVVDLRPRSRKRFDLSGPLADLA